MAHVKIWIQIGALIVGAGLLVYAFQVYRRYRHPFLTHLWFCWLFLNLGLAATVLSEYLQVNFYGNVDLLKTSVYSEVIDPVTSVFFLGLTYSIAALMTHFYRGSTPRNVQWAFIGVGVLFITRAASGILVDRPSTFIAIIDDAHHAALFVMFLLVLVLLAKLAFMSRHVGDERHVRAIRLLGKVYLLAPISVLVSAAFAGPNHGLIRATFALLFNIFPFVWYRTFLPGWSSPVAQTWEDKDLTSLCREYELSKRQRDIIQLLLKGKNNRELAETLFIAPHTVKNHIYAIYRKVGVKNRIELMNLMLEHISKTGSPTAPLKQLNTDCQTRSE
ncbi:MAG: response regulator transcription factor [Candidatus Zixiibacteriota bacterium]|nr:MAG: response regulator transcription factor [candidate division Zixibacteria bacterium]